MPGRNLRFDFAAIRQAVVETCFEPDDRLPYLDPPISLDDLGLLYDEFLMEEEGGLVAHVYLTTPDCPYQQLIAADVQVTVANAANLPLEEVRVVFEKGWTPDRIKPHIKEKVNEAARTRELVWLSSSDAPHISDDGTKVFFKKTRRVEKDSTVRQDRFIVEEGSKHQHDWSRTDPVTGQHKEGSVGPHFKRKKEND